MNERIKELALEANGPNPFYGTLKNQMTLLGDDAVKKFAELIIDDCVQTIIDNTPAPNPEFDTVWELGYNRAMKDCVHHIKENFGLEE